MKYFQRKSARSNWNPKTQETPTNNTQSQHRYRKHHLHARGCCSSAGNSHEFKQQYGRYQVQKKQTKHGRAGRTVQKINDQTTESHPECPDIRWDGWLGAIGTEALQANSRLILGVVGLVVLCVFWILIVLSLLSFNCPSAVNISDPSKITFLLQSLEVPDFRKHLQRLGAKHVFVQFCGKNSCRASGWLQVFQTMSIIMSDLWWTMVK